MVNSEAGKLGFLVVRIWVSVKLLGAIVPVTRPVTQFFARRLGILLPAGNGGWRCDSGMSIEYPPNIVGSCDILCLFEVSEIQVLLGRISGRHVCRSTLLTLPTLAFLLVGAMFMQHYIEIFESWVGGLAMSFNALTFPAITYLQICKPKRMEQRISAFAICSLGMVLPVLLLASP